MKPLLMLILSCLSNVYAQNISFKEIKLKPNPQYYKTNKATIIYPIAVTGRVNVDKLINARIRKEIFDQEVEKQDTRKLLMEQINEYGLINLLYEVSYKKNGILSMNIYQEGCGAHCSSSYTWFNFDLLTGSKITIHDLILEDRLSEFQKLVLSDKQKALKDYKADEIGNLANKTIDSTAYTWALEQVDSSCSERADIENFSLSNQGIEIKDPCEFPYAIRSQEPVFELKYSYRVLSSFLKPKFKRLLLK